MGEVADPPEEPAGNARRAPRASGNLSGALVAQVYAQQSGSAADDLLELFDGVEVEPDRDSEAVAQRCSQQSLASRRADERKARQLDPNRTRRWAFADHQVERAVLHRGIEHFL